MGHGLVSLEKTLPSSILAPRYYARSCTKVVSKHCGKFQAHVSPADLTHHASTPSQSLLDGLGLKFAGFFYEAAPQKPRQGVCYANVPLPFLPDVPLFACHYWHILEPVAV